MDRTTGRALAKQTLEGLALFAKVFVSEPESFGGFDPIAVVHSKSLGIVQDARDDFTSPAEIFVTIYVKRLRDVSESEKDQVEATLDDLARVSLRALWSAFYGEGANVTIGPSETGYPARTFDSANYRMERFAVRFDDDQED